MAKELSESQLGLVSSGVSSAGNIGGAIVSGLFNAHQAKLNREFNAAEAEKARAWAREQWRLENEYNSPAAQMQRYIAAGLNPNLIYGDLGNGLNTAPAAAQGSSGSSPTLDARGLVDTTGILQGRLIEAQIKRLETQNRNDTVLADSQVDRVAELNNVSKAEVRKADAEIELTKVRTKEVTQSIENMKQQWDILDEQKKQEKFETAFIAATQDLKIAATNEQNRAIQETAVALATAQLLNVKADTAMKWSQAALNKQYGKESQSRIRKNNVDMAVARNQAQLIVSQIIGQDLDNEAVLLKIGQQRNYNQTVYGDADDGWFMKSVHTFTGTVDATCKMLGQLLSIHN